MEISGVGALPPASPSFPAPQPTQNSTQTQQNTQIQETQQGQNTLAQESTGSQSPGQAPQAPGPQGPPQGLQASASPANTGPGQLVNIQV